MKALHLSICIALSEITNILKRVKHPATSMNVPIRFSLMFIPTLITIAEAGDFFVGLTIPCDLDNTDGLASPALRGEAVDILGGFISGAILLSPVPALDIMLELSTGAEFETTLLDALESTFILKDSLIEA